MYPAVIRQRMEQLEQAGRDRSVGEAAADICGVPYDADFEQLLSNELWRTQVLCRTHYARTVAVLPPERVMLTAMLQGMTLAAAIRLEQEAAQ